MKRHPIPTFDYPIPRFNYPITRLPIYQILVLLISLASPAAAQQRLTLDDIYDPATRVDFSGDAPRGFVWIDAGRYAWPRPDSGGVEWTVTTVEDGRSRPLFDRSGMEAALARLPGISEADARRASGSRALIFDAQFSAALITLDTELYLYHFDRGEARRLTFTPGDEELASFSPDGDLVAFVRANNLHLLDLQSRRETALTTDGSDTILNGTLDWVYEEEIFGRGERRAYWWSPDSSRIAFLRTDDGPVPTYLTVDDIPYDQVVERWRYPKAGDPNPIVALGVVPASSGPPEWIDIGRYPAADRLLVGVTWMADSRRLLYEVQNRVQTWMDVNVVDLATGAARTILRETTGAWVEPVEGAHPTWLADGSFLWLSDRSGFRHLYHYGADGTLQRQVTEGRWEVRTLHGVDEGAGWVYFSGTERSPVGRDVYRIRLDGSGRERLSRTTGTHTALFDPRLSYYIDSWSDATTPTQVRLHRSDGGEVRAIHDERVAALSRYRLSPPEFVQVPTRDGFAMEAMIIKPPDFDPARRYPVYQFTYGGPRSPRVLDAWGGSQYLYHQLLAQHGIIVWICDNRTASGKGAESAWALYRNFGEVEMRDIEDGVAWLKRQPWVDGARIGLHGWSYGGYLTAYALTHSTSFVMGIAGGPVTDWRDYDSVYTERFLGLPQENPEGYRRSSPRWAARNLHGALMLVHGTIDDNVHVANTMQFAYELQKAQKPFELMLYPRTRHAVTDPALVRHLRGAMLQFTLRHLAPGEAWSGGGKSRE